MLEINQSLLCRHVQEIVLRLLAEKGISVECNAEVVDVVSELDEDGEMVNYLVSADNRRFKFDEAVWCTQAIGQSWLSESGLCTSDEGFVCVDVRLYKSIEAM